MRKHKISSHIDTQERTLQHRKLIKSKYFLKKLYETWYKLIFNQLSIHDNSTIVELGSGGGFIKEIYPEIITSDIIELPSNDMVFSALNMPFKNDSVDAFVMIDTMHHLPDAEKFLNEARRVLRRNGEIIMIEPANTFWGRFIYKNFHHEKFDTKASWKFESDGPLSSSNQALPWIVFFRDEKMFKDLFPYYHIEKIIYLNPLLYLLSGGLTFKQFMPDFLYSTVAFFDKILPRITKEFSMFMFIKIRYLENEL